MASAVGKASFRWCSWLHSFPILHRNTIPYPGPAGRILLIHLSRIEAVIEEGGGITEKRGWGKEKEDKRERGRDERGRQSAGDPAVSTAFPVLCNVFYTHSPFTYIWLGKSLGKENLVLNLKKKKKAYTSAGWAPRARLSN